MKVERQEENTEKHKKKFTVRKRATNAAACVCVSAGTISCFVGEHPSGDSFHLKLTLLVFAPPLASNYILNRLIG